MSEAQFQEDVVQVAHALGWEHMHARRSRGRHGAWTTATSCPWPDLVLWHPRRGGLMFRELKVPAGKDGRILAGQWKPGQREVLRSLAAAGADVDVWVPTDLWSGRIQRELGAARRVA